MTEFAIGDGIGAYHAGLLTLADGRQLGIEAVAQLTRRTSAPAAPDLLGSLRSALPTGQRLAMPLRLAVSTVRAGLGAIEQELKSGSADTVTVDLVLVDGSAFVARMPADLAATMDRDRDVVLAALTRAAPAIVAAEALPEGVETDVPAEALTSIFRYEKRNGRLRRIAGADKAE